MTLAEPQTICSRRFDLAEGPMYHDGIYYWVDIEGRSLHGLMSGKHREVKFDQRVTSVVPYDAVGLLVSTDQKLVLIEAMEMKEEFSTQITLRENTRFNDAKVDPWGNYWVGSMDLEFQSAIGALFCMKPNGDVVEVLDTVTCSNGLCWNKEQSKFYYIDSPTQELIAYDFDPVTLELSERQVIYRELRPEVYPDGMCIDRNGNIWMALWGGGEVLVINPEKACVEDVLALPCPNVTSCCFAGKELNELMVTTASVETDIENFPLAGSVFKFQLDVQGMKVDIFKGNLHGK
jgi:sugar lactone lactonase YvrE